MEVFIQLNDNSHLLSGPVWKRFYISIYNALQ